MSNDLNLVIDAAVSAGKKILQIYNSDFDVNYKKDNSPLTLADKEAHSIILSYLEKTDYPILSEEGKDIPFNIRKTWDKFWLVDPLDGTKEFIKRNGEFTVNIALIKKNKPILGVIYVPAYDTLYYGSDSSAFKVLNYSSDNSSKHKLPIKFKKKKFTIVGSRSHMSKETKLFFDKKQKEIGDIEVLAVGSSLKLCMVAEGKADAYPRYAPTMEWDTAAGHAILSAAGFGVYEYNTTKELNYNKENLLNPWFLVK